MRRCSSRAICLRKRETPDATLSVTPPVFALKLIWSSALALVVLTVMLPTAVDRSSLERIELSTITSQRRIRLETPRSLSPTFIDAFTVAVSADVLCTKSSEIELAFMKYPTDPFAKTCKLSAWPVRLV